MGNPHVLVLPYPAQGHVIPFMELSQSLVKHGIRITFVNTEYIHARVMDSLATKDGMGDQIHLVSIQDGLEPLEDRNNLERHAESVLLLMPKKVEELIDKINSLDTEKITCVIADHNLGWAMDIAADKGIRRAAFSCAAATHLVVRSSLRKLIDDGIIDSDGEINNHLLFKNMQYFHHQINLANA